MSTSLLVSIGGGVSSDTNSTVHVVGSFGLQCLLTIIETVKNLFKPLFTIVQIEHFQQWVLLVPLGENLTMMHYITVL